MDRRPFLLASGAAAPPGCLGGVWNDAPRFMGPTDETPDAVDSRYRRFSEAEVGSIRAEGRAIPYETEQSDVDAHGGAASVFEGPVIVIAGHEDHFAYRISMAGDSTWIHWAFGSRTRGAAAEANRITAWGAVLGPGVFTQRGEEQAVPAVAIADIRGSRAVRSPATRAPLTPRSRSGYGRR